MKFKRGTDLFHLDSEGSMRRYIPQTTNVWLVMERLVLGCGSWQVLQGSARLRTLLWSWHPHPSDHQRPTLTELKRIAI